MSTKAKKQPAVVEFPTASELAILAALIGPKADYETALRRALVLFFQAQRHLQKVSGTQQLP